MIRYENIPLLPEDKVGLQWETDLQRKKGRTVVAEPRGHMADHPGNSEDIP